MSRPVGGAEGRNNLLSQSYRSQNGFLSSSPIANQSIARDLADSEDEEEDDTFNDADRDNEGLRRASEQPYSMAGSYRRTSYVAYGPRPLFPSAQPPDVRNTLSERDREAALAEERSLLRDNQIIPRKHPRKDSTASGKVGLLSKLPSAGFVPRKSGQEDDGAGPDVEGAWVVITCSGL